jgi:hypothetical protein
MAIKTLQDSSHNVIGYLATQPDGRQILEDARHRRLGYYDPKTDKTEDANHKVLGPGNILQALLQKK